MDVVLNYDAGYAGGAGVRAVGGGGAAGGWTVAVGHGAVIGWRLLGCCAAAVAALRGFWLRSARGVPRCFGGG